MIGAIALHAFWNGSAVFLDFFALYMMAQMPLFVLFILGVIALRREEARLTRTRLSATTPPPDGSPRRRSTCSRPRRAGKAALAWARTLRGDRTALMKRFILDATALAAARQRAISGRDPRAAEDEQSCSRGRRMRAPACSRRRCP